jgi:outer membrane protein assembly factor BamB
MGATGMLPDPSTGTDDLAYVALDRRRARYSPRRLLNRLSLLVAVVVLLATFPLWLPLGRHALATLFPPPPYRGTSVYLATQSGFLLALRTSDGTVRWRTPSHAADGELIVAGGNVITVERVVQGQQTDERIVARATTTGQVRWSSPLTQLTVGLLGTEGGTVCAVEAPDLAEMPSSTPGLSQLLAFDARSGQLRWRYLLPSPPALPSAVTEFSGSGPTPLPETLYVGTSGTYADTPQTLTALDLRTGHAHWQVEQAGAILAASASLVYLQLGSGSEAQEATTLLALDALTHQVRWKVALPQPAHPVLAGNDLVVTVLGPSTVLLAYDATTGAPRWKRAGVFFIGQASLPGLAASDPLLVNTGAGYAGLAPAAGEVEWESAWPYPQTSSPNGGDNPPFGAPALGDGRYYWFSGPTAFAVSSGTGTLLWRTSVPNQPAISSDSPATFSEYAGGELYGVEDNELFSLDGASGKLRWSQVISVGLVTTLQVAP